MSGLDSIAMAVAMLEQDQRKAAAKAASGSAMALPSRAGPALREVTADEPFQPTMVSNMLAPAQEEQIRNALAIYQASAFPHASLTAADDSTVGIGKSLIENNWIYDLGAVHSYIFSLDLRELATIPVPHPAEAIALPLENDVLCGRGGETNNHRGNIKYRHYVKTCQAAYIECKRREKPFIAQRIVLTVRKQGGRFLKKDKATGTWRDVGNSKAREKTSQGLREGAPDLRPPHDDEPPYAPLDPSSPKFKSLLTKRATVASLASAVSSPSKKQRCIDLTALNHPNALPPWVASVSSTDQESVDSLSTGGATETLPMMPNSQGPRIKRFKKRVEDTTD